MVECAAAHRIIRETRNSRDARARAERNARDGVVDRKGETRFQNGTDSAGAITAISGIFGRICLRCGRSDRGQISGETNLSDAPGLHWPEPAIAQEISHRPYLRASVARVGGLDLEYGKIQRRFWPDRFGTLHSHPG